jgi:hypothetical protein
MDVVNAGSHYYQNFDTAAAPLGMTMSPATASCTATRVYVPACFDQLTLISGDDTMPAGSPTAKVDTTSGVDILISFPDSPSASTLQARANRFLAGGEILLIQGTTTTLPIQVAPLVLTANATVVGSTIDLKVGTFLPSVDTLHIYDAGSAQTDYSTSFNTTDFVLNLVPTSYSVNSSNQLVRQAGIGGTQDVIAEQIIGFKVAPFTSNPVTGTPRYTNTPSDYNSAWTSLSAVQIQLVARATPGSDGSSNSFQNTYDQGPYQVQALSVVISPRNLSMNN